MGDPSKEKMKMLFRPLTLFWYSKEKFCDTIFLLEARLLR